jgi:putative membrane protein
MKTEKESKKIIEKIKCNPNEMLALGRTVMANERTLLSFITTWLALLAGGIGLIKFVDHPIVVFIGWICIPVSFGFLIWGIKSYKSIQKILNTVADLVSSSNKAGKK